MRDIDVQLWEFEEAPPDLRRLIAEDFAGGWLALISTHDCARFALILSSRWESAGLRLAQHAAGNGQIVLAGQHREPRKRVRAAGAE